MLDAIRIVQGDLTEHAGDAIVTAADGALLGCGSAAFERCLETAVRLEDTGP